MWNKDIDQKHEECARAKTDRGRPKTLELPGLVTNSRNDKVIITPEVIPMRKPKDRLPGLRMTAIRPPKPVPRLATRLSKKALRIVFIVVILTSVSAKWLTIWVSFHNSPGLRTGGLDGCTCQFSIGRIEDADGVHDEFHIDFIQFLS